MEKIRKPCKHKKVIEYVETLIVLFSLSFLLMTCLFSVQYAVHLLGYLKKWRKSPHWSFSCCLEFLLPLIDLSGDIGGVVGTDVLSTQLDTGHMEMSATVGVVQGSGTFDASVKENEQDHYNLPVLQEENCNDTKLETGRNKEPTVHKGSGANDTTLGDGGDNGNSGEVQEGNGKNDLDINKKFHQGTQTELSIIVYPRHQITSMGQY